MIILDGTEVKVEHFPDGTQRIVLENLPKMEWRNTHEITWKFEMEEELSTLIYVTRHLRNMPCIQEIYLNLLYLPNARMDRIHNQREVFTLRGFADAIKGVNCDSSVAFSGRKIYANVYIDDRGGLIQIYNELLTLIEKIENGDVKHE